MASQNGKRVKIDRSGRLVLPKRLRERLGIRMVGELEIVEQPEGVLLRAVEERPAMVKIGELWVHRGAASPDVSWENVVRSVREERIDSLLKG
jgi:AbrB family looped-hinge helix DNA binding protein